MAAAICVSPGELQTNITKRSISIIAGEMYSTIRAERTGDHFGLALMQIDLLIKDYNTN